MFTVVQSTIAKTNINQHSHVHIIMESIQT